MNLPAAVTFDCWGTLIYEPKPATSYERRLELLARAAGEELGLRLEQAEAARMDY